jgi:hypothetical protein
MTIVTTGNIALTSIPSYCTEDEWRDKTGISESDESSAQFVIDSREAHFLIRRSCMYLVRERIIYKRNDNKAYLPIRYLSDGNMDGTIDSNDILIYQLTTDGISLEMVDKTTYLDSIDSFNNCITFKSASSALTRPLLVTYYAIGKNNDEIVVDELKRAVMAQVTVLVIERLRKKWGLKGTTSWSVPGVNVNKDLTSYKELLEEAKKDLSQYINFLRPFVGHKLKTGFGSMTWDYRMSYTDNYLNNFRRRY